MYVMVFHGADHVKQTSSARIETPGQRGIRKTFTNSHYASDENGLSGDNHFHTNHLLQSDQS